MFDKMFSSASYLHRGLDAASLRNQVITNNIANAETPNFKSSSVEFESFFNDALNSGFTTKVTRGKHMEFTPSANNVRATIIPNNTTTQRMDGNNVDIDFQNAELAKNQIYVSSLIEKLNSEYRRLRMAIREGS